MSLFRRVRTASLEVDGAYVHYEVRGLAAGTTLVLVHGNGANTGWWHWMVPALERRYRLVLVDITGHGDSGHRASYSMELWVDEVLAVVRAVGGPVILVGHSMGGAICAGVAAAAPDVTAGLILFDTNLVPETDHGEQPPRTQKHYPTKAAILERFVLVPRQPQPDAKLVAPVGRASIRRTPEGWTWKTDQTRRISSKAGFGAKVAAQVQCPALLVRGEHSLIVSDADLERARATIGERAEAALMRDVHHHLVIEDAAECVRLVDYFVARVLNGEAVLSHGS